MFGRNRVRDNLARAGINHSYMSDYTLRDDLFDGGSKGKKYFDCCGALYEVTGFPNVSDRAITMVRIKCVSLDYSILGKDIPATFDLVGQEKVENLWAHLDDVRVNESELVKLISNGRRKSKH